MLHVVDDADDRAPGRLRFVPGQLQPLADGILRRPVPIRESAADDDDQRRVFGVGSRECAAGLQVDAQGVEVARRDRSAIGIRPRRRRRRGLSLDSERARRIVAGQRQIVSRTDGRRSRHGGEGFGRAHEERPP